MRLWRACKTKACWRRRGCGGDVDQCGARCAPKAWAWVHQVLAAIRSGTTRARGRALAADRAAPGSLTWVFNLGDEVDEVSFKNADGSWTRIDDQAPPSELTLQLRRLRGGSAGWLRAVGRAMGRFEFAMRSRVPAEASVCERRAGT